MCVRVVTNSAEIRSPAAPRMSLKVLLVESSHTFAVFSWFREFGGGRRKDAPVRTGAPEADGVGSEDQPEAHHHAGGAQDTQSQEQSLASHRWKGV